MQIARLELALAAETKRRVDATTSLDEDARRQVLDMEQRIQRQLQEDNKRLEERLSKIESRLEGIEFRWKKVATQQVESIQLKADEFAQTLEAVQREQDAERKARLRREGRLLQQVEDLSKEYNDRWSSERHDRVTHISKLEEKVDEQEALRAQEQQNFSERVEEELQRLRRDLEEEVQERLTQDEQIVAALNRYTQQLQQSLSILSSD